MSERAALRVIDDAAVISPAPRHVWESVFAADPDATPSQSPRWLDAMCAQSSWRDASRLYVSPSGRHVVMPLVAQGVGKAVTRCSPRPGWAFGGALAPGGVTAADAALVLQDLEQLGGVRTYIRPNPLGACAWHAHDDGWTRIPHCAHVLALEAGRDAVWDGVHPSTRRRIETARTNGVRIETRTCGDLLPEFFDVLSAAQQHWAAAQHEPLWLTRVRSRAHDSKTRWIRVAANFGDEFVVSVAWFGEQPAAAAITLHGTNAHGVRMAMNRAVGSTSGASHLLAWSIVEGAIASGARHLNLGESANAGAADFKRFLGAVPLPFDELTRERVPITPMVDSVRGLVKKTIGFRDPDVARGLDASLDELWAGDFA